VRIPGWARGEPVPGDLYRFQKPTEKKPALKVNGKSLALRLEKGYVPITRIWRSGDVIELNLPMPIRRIVSHPEVKENVGKGALQRGPIVYCAEGIDNQGRALNILIPYDVNLASEYLRDFLGGVVVLKGWAFAMEREGDKISPIKQAFQAIPYCIWSNRGVGEMAVWLWRDVDRVKLN
jgi:DUF1680 family protein